jgi:DNA polymerase III subunit alpha
MPPYFVNLLVGKLQNLILQQADILNLMSTFTHIHVHSQYSILDGASDISELLSQVKNLGMEAIALTDHGNMFGAKEFHNEAKKKGVKAIIGCEMYVAENSRFEKTGKEDRSGYHLILLAKNKTGYMNLSKLVSFAWLEGFYYKPRIDKELLFKYHEGIIVSSACLGGEVPQTILNIGKEEAEKKILQYKSVFGEDYYLELQRHKSGNPQMDADTFAKQQEVNAILTELAKKHNIKLIASNDVHFIRAEDAEAHDRLICLNTGKDLDDPNRLMYTKQEYLKSPEEMKELFSDIPEAVENTKEIADKVEVYDLDNHPIMPDFPLPGGFTDEDEYLRHLTYEGAKKRYAEITPEIQERIDFELSVIKKMGYPGYFLIVQDFLRAAREMSVSVGPGRGSAAGSVVAYCNQITDIDPLRYNLLFERFLNPDRVSMPDIDIDFDEDGRELVLKYVVEKYGKNRVGHIITFGTMAAKMAIRDIARVQKLSLPEADKLAKLVPERPGTKLKDAFREVRELEMARNSPNELVAKTLKFAETLEGSVRHTGLHACGIIISKDDLIEHIPVCTSKDSDLLVTQYDGNHVEAIGMLKMDFLGLKTLSIIKDSLENIKLSRSIEIDIQNLPLDDKETYELFSRGETTAIFQFESAGMKKNLRELKPNRFEDLIAMNALYRPGPMEYIPSFIHRKHGKEAIVYPIPEMENYLKDTYGITVYQEQVMQLAQSLAGFTRGQADSLRKAMGKKIRRMMDELKEMFVQGCMKNGHQEEVALKIWSDWEAFAQYAFNKSHSTCYAYIAYQTAYLKAHYPAEFMAAVLSRNISDIKKITGFMDECKRMGILVLGPDVNESNLKFTVNKEGNIRFGLGAIKGIGENAVNKIIEERISKGPFTNIYNFAERIHLQSINKKSFEVLAVSGAFDCFGELTREQFFGLDTKGYTFIDNLIRYGVNFQADKANQSNSLFGGMTKFEIPKIEIPVVSEWSKIERLNKEKELIGIFLSAHPLDEYQLEINNFVTHNLNQLGELSRLRGKDISVAGIVTAAKELLTKNGRPYGRMSIEDYTGSYEITMFGNDFVTFRNYFVMGYTILIKGRIAPRFQNENELELKVNKITLLSNVREELIKSITLKMPFTEITDDMIDRLIKLSEKNKGKILLKFKIYDRADGIAVDLFSRTKKINLTDDFMEFLNKNSIIEIAVN